jgi:hypothetical protein
VDHTPTVAAGDDRAIRLLEHAALPADRKDRLVGLVKLAQEAAAESGAELQAEFGREHVGLIVGCNQFVRLFRAGPEPGAVELLLDDSAKAALREAGVELRPPEGTVFKLFGWVRVDPAAAQAGALEQALRSALAKALAAKRPS